MRKQELSKRWYVQYKEGEGRPTLGDYMAELDVKIFSPLYVIHEMLMLLDEAEDGDEEKQRHLMNILWATLETWKEIDSHFRELSKEYAHEKN